MSRKVAIVGSHGLYAKYGGFEELVKNLAEKKTDEVQYTIFNSKVYPPPIHLPSSIKVKQLPFRANGFQGLFYDFWSILVCYFTVDTILLLGVQGIPLIPLLRLFKKVRIVSNVGGIEWLRPNFNRILKWYFKWCFNLSMIHSDIVILDNLFHRDFLPARVKSKIKIIPYGGEIDSSLEVTNELEKKYPFIYSDYYLSVNRSQEDNQIAELCQSFVGKARKLVMISNLSSTLYGQEILKNFQGIPNIILIDGLYVKPELDLVRRNCKAYIHTHKLCGTAPSLVEMIIARRPILSFDNPQNRNTLNGEGFYYNSFNQVHELLDNSDDLTRFIPSNEVCDQYGWAKIVAEYESCYFPS